jgi:methionyl-tRNA formyltransferase
MENIKILYMGTTRFSAYILEALVEYNYNIIALISQPDRKIGRKQEIMMTPTKEVALSQHIRVYGFEDINDKIDLIRELDPDLIITCAYGQKITKEILEIPRLGAINVHASLLPKYRGGAPIHYAVMNGDKVTGNTIMYMEEGLDTGAMLAKSEVAITLDDTTSTLSDKLMINGANLLIDTLPDLIADEIIPIKQDETLVSYSYNIPRSLEYIDFNRDVLVVYNHMRGLIEIPGCYAHLNNKKIKFYQVAFKKCDVKEVAGTIVVDSAEHFKIACLDGYIKVFKFQLEGKKIIDFKTYSHGNKLEISSGVVMNEEGDNNENRSK